MQVNFKEDGKRKDRIFNITINLAATIDIAALLQFVRWDWDLHTASDAISRIHCDLLGQCS